MIDPVPVKVTVVPLIGAFIEISVGSILRTPPALIRLFIEILLLEVVTKLTSPLVVKPTTEPRLPTTKLDPLCKFRVPTPEAAMVFKVFVELLKLKLPLRKVNPYMPELTAPAIFIKPSPPSAVFPPRVIEPR